METASTITIEGIESNLGESASNETAHDKRMKDYLTKVMPGSRLLKEGDLKMDELIRESDHLLVRAVNLKDIAEMDGEKAAEFERRIARKTRVYDPLRKVGINLYSWEANRKVRSAERLRTRLEQNLATFQRELHGAAYTADISEMHKDIWERLPDYLRKKYSSTLQPVQERAGEHAEAGMKGLQRSLGQKGRMLRDMDDLLSASIVKYDTDMAKIKEQVSSITQQLATEPTNKKLLQKRAEHNATYASYEAESDKLRETQDKVVDDLLVVKAEYDIVKEQISLREAAIDVTKKRVQELTTSLKCFEPYQKGRKDMVFFGGHIMDCTLARQISEAIYVGGVFSGGAAQYILSKQKDLITKEKGLQPNGAFGSPSKVEMIANELKSHKRQEAEEFKRTLDNGLYR